jgi:Carboxypeptidase regulatory-like domain
MVIRTLGCWLLFALGIFAQSGGTITGTVVDLSGDPVAKAEIQATNAETKAVFKATTSATGVYTLAQLPAGTYELTSATPGFSRFVQSNVMVTAAQTLQLNLRMVDFQLNTLGDGRDSFAAVAAPHPVPAGPAPHMPDGKPDLSGMWFQQKTIAPGKPEIKAWAEAVVKERAENNAKEFPQSRCQPLGIMLAPALLPWKTVQTPTLLVIIAEGDLTRQVFLDGRAHPKDLNPAWLGHSIGRWDGDTLVVDTTGFNDKAWFDGAGVPHTEKMHITERFHRVDLGHLEIEFSIEDPDTFVKPWVIKRAAELAPNDEIQEYVCTENERDREHLVGK